jgi:hypothetical protein
MADGVLPYAVCFCDSSSSAGGGGSINLQGDGRGWCSRENARYPVELGLQFEGRVNVRTVTFTSHQHLIPSGIELLVGSAIQRASADAPSQRHTQADYATASFTKLGHTRLDTNESSNYRAREVKRVHVDATAHFLKLLIHEPHPNLLNTQQQVGLIEVRIEGKQELGADYSGVGLVPDLLSQAGAMVFTHDAGLDAHFMELGLDPSAARAVPRQVRTPQPLPIAARSDQTCRLRTLQI